MCIAWPRTQKATANPGTKVQETSCRSLAQFAGIIHVLERTSLILTKTSLRRHVYSCRGQGYNALTPPSEEALPGRTWSVEKTRQASPSLQCESRRPVLKPPWTAYSAVIGCFIARAITQQGMRVIGWAH